MFLLYFKYSLQLFVMVMSTMKITISKALPGFETLVVGLFENDEFISNVKVLQDKQIIDNIKRFNDFNRGFGEFFSITSSEGKNVVVAGLGKRDENKELNIGGEIYCELSILKIKRAAISIEGNAANVAYGAFLCSFKFDKYKTKKDEKVTEVEEITVLAKYEQFSSAEKSFESLRQEGEGIFLAHTHTHTCALTTEQHNVLYPESYADYIKTEITKLGLEIEVLGKKQMEEKKNGSIAWGSTRE